MGSYLKHRLPMHTDSSRLSMQVPTVNSGNGHYNIQKFIFENYRKILRVRGGGGGVLLVEAHPLLPISDQYTAQKIRNILP